MLYVNGWKSLDGSRPRLSVCHMPGVTQQHGSAQARLDPDISWFSHLLISFLTLLGPSDFWNNKDWVWTYLSSLMIQARCGQICPILFYIKVWTLCFLSLVIFTTWENNDFRMKAKCSYLIFAHSCYDHQSLPGHICPNPVRIGLKGITKKLNDKTEPLNGQDTYLGEIHHFQIKKIISRLLDRFPFTIRQGSKKEIRGVV